MKILIQIVALFIAFQLNAQRFSADGVYIPKNLSESFQELDKFLPLKFKDSVKILAEKDFTSSQHFGLGMWMRNNWELWNKSRLYKHFKKKGIFHPDDMSGIILKSYHRYLNNVDVRIDEQIQHYKNYWIEAKKFAGPTIKDFPDPDMRYNGGIVY